MAKKPPKKQIIEAIVNSAGLMTLAAEKLNVSRTSLYKWINNDPKLKDAIFQAKEGIKDLAESKLYSNVKAGKEASVFFILKTLAKDRGYIEKQQIGIDKDAQINVGYMDDADE